MTRLFTRSLPRSRVGVRMLALFLLCAGVPLTGLAGVTVMRTTRALEDRAWQRLSYEARLFGQDGLGRLDAIADTVNLIAAIVTGPSTHAEQGLALASSLFPVPPRALAILPDDGAAINVVGALAVPALSADQEQHLDDWGRLIVEDPNDTDLPILIVAGSSDTRSWRAAVVVDPAVVFRLDSPDQIPVDAAACLATPSTGIACSADSGTDVALQALQRTNEPRLIVESQNAEYLVRPWEVSLEGQYGSTAWKLFVIRPRSVVRAPIAGLARDFWLVALLAMLATAWVGLTQVRTLLRPLEILTAATKRLSTRRFDERIDIRSHDEFETLGEAFNSLSIQLKRQFTELEALSHGALVALARAIDAKSPWTAGHSERVTTLAVALAEQMNLPEGEVEELRRGGLVHDVGKLATPPEILDKAERLTPEEEQIMRLHPQQGVHILEPVPAFGPILPIVGQHHERWDGCGYPAGLAGEQISRTARVLAVADSYDAMRSDRPYRKGLDPEKAAQIIVRGAGSQFDPDVVAAFVELSPEARARQPLTSVA